MLFRSLLDEVVGQHDGQCGASLVEGGGDEDRRSLGLFAQNEGYVLNDLGDARPGETDNLVTQDSIIVTTSVLNLAENQTEGEEVN